MTIAANSLSFTGLGSGLDTSTLINSLVQAESTPLNALQAKQSNVDAATQTVTSFSAALSTLKAATDALATSAQFTGAVATTSDPILAASAGASAAVGSFDVSVTSVANAQRTYSNPQTTSTTALGKTGSVVLSMAGTSKTIQIVATDSLADIATKFATSGVHIAANVLFDGTSYRLQVQGLDTGSANKVSMVESGNTLGLSVKANTFQDATDAIVSVDGISYTRPTNQVVGAIPGVTLAVTKLTTDPVTVTVGSDSTALAKKIATFVSAYNSVVTAEHRATGYGSAPASNPVLAGDGTLRRALSKLATIMTSKVPNAVGAFHTLGEAGLKVGSDGTVSLDTDKLNAAILKDPSSVERLFVADTSNGSTGAMKAMSDAINNTAISAGSPLHARLDALGTLSKRLVKDEASMQTRLDAYQTQLKAQFLALDSVVNQYRAEGSALTSLSTTTSTTG